MHSPLRKHPAGSRTLPRAPLSLIALVLGTALAGCAQIDMERGSAGSSHTYRSQQPPDRAARCFARNAEEHSSALVSEVTVQENRADVVVNVKNGVRYAHAEFKRSGSGSVGAITLNVVTSGRQSDLIDSLTEGC